MNRMSHALGAVALGLMVAIALAVSGSAETVAQLEQLAGHDAMPEVRQAAATALIPQLVASSMSDEALTQLARTAPSAELRSAAARALGERLVADAQDVSSLESLAAQGTFPEVRQVAAAQLSTSLQSSSPSLATLVNLATSGASSELRGAAVPALAQALDASTQSLDQLIGLSQSGSTAEYRRAAAEAVTKRIEGSVLLSLDQKSLTTIVGGGKAELPETLTASNTELRSAAAIPLERALAQAGWTVDQLVALAGDPSHSAPLRAAASRVLSTQLLGANLPLPTLESYATGATPELRAAPHDALVQTLVGAVGAGLFSDQSLATSVSSAASEELAEAEADALFVLLRTTLVQPAIQSDLESIVNGGSATIAGVAIDGSIEAFRVAAQHYLTGIYTFYGFLDRFDNPLADLTKLAGDPALTSEYREAAAQALVPVFFAQSGAATATLQTLSSLLSEVGQQAGTPTQALQALEQFSQTLSANHDLLVTTAEVGGELTATQLVDSDLMQSIQRIKSALTGGNLFSVPGLISAAQTTLQSLGSGVGKAPDVSQQMLETTAAQGATSELQWAASQGLAERLQRNPPTLTTLEQLAQSAAGPLVQAAAIPALAQALASERTSLPQLANLAVTGPTGALRSAAAQALFQLPALSQAPLATLQRLADGGSVQVGILTLDGQNDLLRGALVSALSTALSTNGTPKGDLIKLATTGSSADLRQAAADALVPQLEQPGGASISQLISWALDGASDQLKEAAAEALQHRWISSGTSESELYQLLAVHTGAYADSPQASPQLSQALANALAAAMMQMAGSGS